MKTERDEALRRLAYQFSALVDGQQFDIALGAALLWLATQCDLLDNIEANEYAARKLREIAFALDPTPDDSLHSTPVSTGYH